MYIVQCTCTLLNSKGCCWYAESVSELRRRELEREDADRVAARESQANGEHLLDRRHEGMLERLESLRE